MQRSMNTQRAYETDWRSFERWCEGDPFAATPADICRYVFDQYPRLAAGTIARHLSAIRWRFHAEGLISPTDHPDVFACRQEIARRDRYREARHIKPIDYPMLNEIIEAIEGYPNAVKAVRDRALVLTGWWSGLERQPLTKLWTEDVSLMNGAKIKVWQRHNRSAGPRIVPRDGRLDMWDALEHWRKQAGITEGPLWFAVDRHGNIRDDVLNPQSVSLVVKEGVIAAGIEPMGYSANSLRYGGHAD